VETGKSVILFTPLLSGLELRHGNGNSMEEVRSVRAENHFGTHLPLLPIWESTQRNCFLNPAEM
jgi:hypothetical protein